MTSARNPQRLPRFDSLQQETFLNLWRAYDRLRILEDRLFDRFELTPQQYNVLRLLRAAHPGALRTLEIASRLVSRAPDITRMLDRLVERKLIARDRPASNRREVHVTLTESGLALLQQLAEPVRACHEEQLGHLTESQLTTLIRLLRLVRQPHEDANTIWSEL